MRWKEFFSKNNDCDDNDNDGDNDDDNEEDIDNDTLESTKKKTIKDWGQIHDQKKQRQLPLCGSVEVEAFSTEVEKTLLLAGSLFLFGK